MVETAIIERYRRSESSVGESLIEMFLAGVSVRCMEDVTESPWGSRTSASPRAKMKKRGFLVPCAAGGVLIISIRNIYDPKEPAEVGFEYSAT